jgi:hypothetical protein
MVVHPLAFFGTEDLSYREGAENMELMIKLKFTWFSRLVLATPCYLCLGGSSFLRLLLHPQHPSR